METVVGEAMKQAWVNDQPVKFSFARKHLIHFGYHKVEAPGTFQGKLYGYETLKNSLLIMEGGKCYAIFLTDLI